MFRFEFSDNLNFRHLSKIESISPEAKTQGPRDDRGQRILNAAAAGRFEKQKFHHARQIGPRDPAQTRRRAPQRRCFSVRLSGAPIRFSDK
jgi:hypothetical protein